MGTHFSDIGRSGLDLALFSGAVRETGKNVLRVQFIECGN